MSVFRPKLWSGLGVALAMGGLAACSNASEPTAAEGEGEAGAVVAAPTGEGEGEGGSGLEAGAAQAYAGVSEASLPALRIGHLEGFFRAALATQPVEGDEAAAALAGQGLLEVFDPSAAAYAELGLDEAVLRRAAETGTRRDLEAALVQFEQARARAGGEPGEVVAALAGISAGLYRNVVVDGTVDPVEYQHALGAALAAQAVARDASDLAGLRPEVDRLVALWPSPQAPETAAEAPTYGQVQAQVSRIDLAA